MVLGKVLGCTNMRSGCILRTKGSCSQLWPMPKIPEVFCLPGGTTCAFMRMESRTTFTSFSQTWIVANDTKQAYKNLEDRWWMVMVQFNFWRPTEKWSSALIRGQLKVEKVPATARVSPALRLCWTRCLPRLASLPKWIKQGKQVKQSHCHSDPHARNAASQYRIN